MNAVNEKNSLPLLTVSLSTIFFINNNNLIIIIQWSLITLAYIIIVHRIFHRVLKCNILNFKYVENNFTWEFRGDKSNKTIIEITEREIVN